MDGKVKMKYEILIKKSKSTDTTAQKVETLIMLYLDKKVFKDF